MGTQAYRTILLAGTALGIALTASLALAQTATGQQPADGDVELAPIYIDGAPQEKTATRTERATLQERMVEDLDELGERVDAGVNVNRTTGSINIRGLDQNRVLTTVDGIRVPWLTDPRESARGGLNTIDFDGLSSLDIVRGADSSVLGSGALGGAVLFRTLDPEDLIEDGKNYGILTKGVYDSTDESWRTNAAVALRHNDTWLLVQGGYKQGHERDNMGDVGGYGATRTEPNPRDFDQRNVLVKLHQYVEGGHRFGLTGELFNRDDDIDNMTGTTSSYQQGTFKSGEEANRRRISGEYLYEAPDKESFLDNARLIAYWQDQKLNNTTDAIRVRSSLANIIPGDPYRYGFPFGPYLRDNSLKAETYGLTGSADKTFDLGGASHTLRFGGEVYGQKMTQYSWGEDNCPDINWGPIPQPFGPQACRMLHSNASDMPDVDSSVVGFFVEDDIKLFDGSLTLTPGIRFDWYKHDPKSTDAFEDSPNYDPAYLVGNEASRFSPKLRAAWELSPEFEIWAQWAQGFRAPSATELYQNYGSPASYARVGNPDLEAETSNGFEIGFNHKGTNYSVSGTVFNNYYRNFIDQVQLAPPGVEYPVGGIIGYENIARVQIYGAELRGEWNFAENWRTWGSVAGAVGRNRDDDTYINSIPALRAILGVGYATEHWGADVSTTLAAGRDKVSAGGFQAPGYGLVDATLWLQPEQIKGLRIQAGVFNILDRKYWNAVNVPDSTAATAVDRFTEPGRTYKLAISQKF